MSFFLEQLISVLCLPLWSTSIAKEWDEEVSIFRIGTYTIYENLKKFRYPKPPSSSQERPSILSTHDFSRGAITVASQAPYQSRAYRL